MQDLAELEHDERRFGRRRLVGGHKARRTAIRLRLSDRFMNALSSIMKNCALCTIQELIILTEPRWMLQKTVCPLIECGLHNFCPSSETLMHSSPTGGLQHGVLATSTVLGEDCGFPASILLGRG